MKYKLTEKEEIVLKAFISESIDCCGRFGPDENMSWNNANDLADATGMNLQQIGGIMASLEDKQLICNHGESARGARAPDWTANDEAVEYGEKWFDLDEYGNLTTK